MRTCLIVKLLGAACLFACNSYAQLVNKGNALTLSPGSLIYVDADFVNQKGTVQNDGQIEVKGGNIFNSDPQSDLFGSQSKGEVVLSGSAQRLSGSRIVFPNLTLKGTGDKTLETDIDINESGILSLGDRQLKAESYSIHVLNPNPAAIIPGTGFISTNTKGTLVRNTNSDASYLFPLGSSAPNGFTGVAALYRPLEFKPQSPSGDSFSASLIPSDPTLGGYDITKKRYDVKAVSDKYYYILSQKAGSSKFDVTFYQNSAHEIGSTQLVSWGNYLQWEKAAPSTTTTGEYFDDLNGSKLNTNIKFSSNQVFHNTPFTFSSEAGGVNPFTFFNAFSPDGDNRNDTWTINNIDLYPDNKLSIYNRWGDEVFSAKGYTNEKAWDGGNLQPGTYYYVLTAQIENQPRVFKGFITMIKKN